jgi:hypothetical protein
VRSEGLGKLIQIIHLIGPQSCDLPTFSVPLYRGTGYALPLVWTSQETEIHISGIDHRFLSHPACNLVSISTEPSWLPPHYKAKSSCPAVE